MLTLILTALAGGVGGACRFLVDSVISAKSRASLPIGTIVVNVTACFFLGVLTGVVTLAGGNEALKMIAGVGFLGGYSTFSTAAVEGARLWRQGRPGATLSHVAVMAGLSFLGAIGGLALVGLFAH